MATITLHITLPDDDRRILEYGTESLACSYADGAMRIWTDDPGHLDVFWRGPNAPATCPWCGDEAEHVDGVCPAYKPANAGIDSIHEHGEPIVTVHLPMVVNLWTTILNAAVRHHPELNTAMEDVVSGPDEGPQVIHLPIRKDSNE